MSGRPKFRGRTPVVLHYSGHEHPGSDDRVRAPPPAFSGGGKWEAMHGWMAGYYEIRATGPGRRHYRLFCRLENGSSEELARLGFDRPQIVVINGMVKTNAALFSDGEYKRHVRDLGDDYLSRAPERLPHAHQQPADCGARPTERENP